MTLDLFGHRLTLLPERAVLFPDLGPLLVVADLHLGKSAAFRASGVPVPEGDTSRDLQALGHLACRHHATRIAVAGDVFHSAAGFTREVAAAFQSFASDCGFSVHCAEGNHDRRLRGKLAAIPHELRFGELRIVHEPDNAEPEGLHVCGHWHPAVSIRDGRHSIRMQCFLLRANVLVLPAFGGFTGGARVSPEPGDRCFVRLRDEVVELPPDAVRR